MPDSKPTIAKSDPVQEFVASLDTLMDDLVERERAQEVASGSAKTRIVSLNNIAHGVNGHPPHVKNGIREIKYTTYGNDHLDVVVNDYTKYVPYCWQYEATMKVCLERAGEGLRIPVVIQKFNRPEKRAEPVSMEDGSLYQNVRIKTAGDLLDLLRQLDTKGYDQLWTEYL